MKPLKVNEVLDLLKKDGWYKVGQEGSHRQYKHPTKKGRVTVNSNPALFSRMLILKRAGLLLTVNLVIL